MSICSFQQLLSLSNRIFSHEYDQQQEKVSLPATIFVVVDDSDFASQYDSCTMRQCGNEEKPAKLAVPISP